DVPVPTGAGHPDPRAGPRGVDGGGGRPELGAAAGGEPQPVVLTGEAERLGHPRRAAGEVDVAPGRRPPRAGELDAVDHLPAAQEDRARPALLAAPAVRAPVHAAGEVDVQPP